MKRIISFLVACFLLVLLFSVGVFAEGAKLPEVDSAIPLRAGGGGGGGGGGGHSHSSGSSRPPTLFESIVEMIVFPFFFFSSTIFFYIQLTKRATKSKKLMKQMMKSDNAWKYQDISTTVSDAYFAIQRAWADMNLPSAARYLSEELYDSFKIKLNWMAYRNEKNVLDKIRLVQALPVAVNDDPDNSRDYIWFYIKGRMVDYTINTETQMKISGSTHSTTFVEYWQFIRRGNDWVLHKILQKDEENQIPFTE